MRLAGFVAVGGCALVAACAFNPSGLGDVAGDGPDARADAPGPTPDGAGPTVDAPGPIDAAIDAPCADVDSDGICDSGDDWLCGLTRPSVTFPITVGTVEISDATADLSGAVAQISPGTHTFALNFSMTESGTRRIRVGAASGTQFGCHASYEAVAGWTVPPYTFTTGPAGTVVSVVAQVTEQPNCNGGWQGGAPAAPIVAYYCVR